MTGDSASSELNVGSSGGLDVAVGLNVEDSASAVRAGGMLVEPSGVAGASWLSPQAANSANSNESSAILQSVTLCIVQANA